MLDRSQVLYRAAGMIASFGRANMYSASSLSQQSCPQRLDVKPFELIHSPEKRDKFTLNCGVVYNTATGGLKLRTAYSSAPQYSIGLIYIYRSSIFSVMWFDCGIRKKVITIYKAFQDGHVKRNL
ncbi:hypothetical protein [Solibacillus sp. FSL K6-1554]|uniref:hypothetical protein n=1 Tax=Solibacillus sp. FSL K6-1554 TaxID=2921472 RepID=UPI0030FAC351